MINGKTEYTGQSLTNLAIIRLVSVDQIYTLFWTAETRYWPLDDKARAEMAPEIVSLLENIDVFVQEERDITAISVKHCNGPYPLLRRRLPWVRVATKKYWPDACHTTEQSWSNPGDLQIFNYIKDGSDNSTHSASAATGMIPSIVASSFGSSVDTSQAMILPSEPHVVYDCL